MCNQEDNENSGYENFDNATVAASSRILFHCSGNEGRLQESCEFRESANILSSTSVYINKEFSKPCKCRGKSANVIIRKADYKSCISYEKVPQHLVFNFCLNKNYYNNRLILNTFTYRSRTPKITYRRIYR
jgi:hypothetical protein